MSRGTGSFPTNRRWDLFPSMPGHRNLTQFAFRSPPRADPQIGETHGQTPRTPAPAPSLPPPPGRARRPERARRHPQTRHLPRLGNGFQSADLAGRQPDHLHPRLDRQAERPPQLVDLHHGCRRQPPARAGRGRIFAKVVAERRPHSLHRRGRSRGKPDPRPLDGRRGRGNPDHPSGELARERGVVSRRDADRLHHVDRFGPPLAHQPAGASGGRRMDRGAQGRRPARLPA